MDASASRPDSAASALHGRVVVIPTPTRKKRASPRPRKSRATNPKSCRANQTSGHQGWRDCFAKQGMATTRPRHAALSNADRHTNNGSCIPAAVGMASGSKARFEPGRRNRTRPSEPDAAVGTGCGIGIGPGHGVETEANLLFRIATGGPVLKRTRRAGHCRLAKEPRQPS